jgi:hypothetical protein
MRCSSETVNKKRTRKVRQICFCAIQISKEGAIMRFWIMLASVLISKTINPNYLAALSWDIGFLVIFFMFFGLFLDLFEIFRKS